MSQQHWVNRIDQSTFQKIEEAKLAESEVVPDGTVPVGRMITHVNEAIDSVVHQAAKDLGYVKTEYQVPNHVGETVVLQPHQHAVYAEKITHVDEAIELDDNIGNVESASGDFNPAKALLAQILDEAIRNSDLEFKRQVIAAFKHLGLDCRKFFGV